jgi:hypothetical protein
MAKKAEPKKAPIIEKPADKKTINKLSGNAAKEPYSILRIRELAWIGQHAPVIMNIARTVGKSHPTHR